MDNIPGKTILVTGAGSGFGSLIARKAAALGAKVVCLDINADAVQGLVDLIRSEGGTAEMQIADVTRVEDLRSAVAFAVDRFGRVDVLVNNAGIMPLAFLADHAAALDAWNKCIDINFKGVMNGTVAVYDQMIAQGAGQIVNISSIYGNHPVVGASVYGATKAAVNYFSNSVRQEARGKINVTIIKPTGVPATGLGGTVINPAGIVGIIGQNGAELQQYIERHAAGSLPPEATDPASIGYAALDPDHIAEAVIHVINQPLGITLSEVTVRASSDPYIL
jgi:NADP-dependent 3-hydroxy acid dehydrogenase YdfG